MRFVDKILSIAVGHIAYQRGLAASPSALGARLPGYEDSDHCLSVRLSTFPDPV
jgi:hypothetical protein